MSEPTTRFLVGRREGGKRLDHFLHERIPGLSRTRIQRAIRERVALSWRVDPRSATPVRSGGVVSIGYTPPVETPLAIPIPVIARGAGWLVVDKPAGIPVHPVNKIRENTLIRMLRRQEDHDGLRLVHRLDRETSGALLIAEDAPTSRRLATAFMRGEVHKEYLAIVAGRPGEDEGEIDLPIGRDEDSRVWVRQRAGVGQACSTRWRVIAREQDRTLVLLLPRTGRRHQLRVHMAALGHPVVGDLLYGWPDEAYLDLVRDGRDARVEAGGPRRQLLHCARLVLAGIDVRAPLPADFARVG